MEDASGDDVPLNPADLRIDSQVVSVDLLLRKLPDGTLALPDAAVVPPRWKEGQASTFIESLLARIPLSELYLDGTQEGPWAVIDGTQRLRVLRDFLLSDALALGPLELFPELEGKRFSELPRTYSRRLEESQVTVHLVEKGTPPALALSVYRRLQPGLVPMAQLAARHAGKGWAQAVTLSRSLPLSEPPPSLRHVERSLRLAALVLDRAPTPVRTLAERLDAVLTQLGGLSEEALSALGRKLAGALRLVESALDKEGWERPSQSPAALEAWVAVLASLATEAVPATLVEAIRATVKALDVDPEFRRASQVRTASAESLRERVSRIQVHLAPLLPG